MNLKRHKKKLIAGGIVILLVSVFAVLPLAVKPSAELLIRANGFPKAEMGSIRFLPSGVYVDKILLDPNGFTEIEDIQIQGSWRDLLLNRHAEKISVKNISVSGEIDKSNRITIAGWDGTFKNEDSGGKKILPFGSLYLDGITLDLDTPFGVIRAQSKVNIDAATDGGKIVTASIVSTQRQLTTDMEVKGNLTSDGVFSGKIDIEETSVNIAPVEISRASGWIEFKTGKDFTAAGQIVAGGMKYNLIPFEDINLAFDTAQKTPAVFKTKATGREIFLSGTWVSGPRSNLIFTLSAPSLNDIAAFGQEASLLNDVLSGTGPVEITASLDPASLVKDDLPVSATLVFKKKSIRIATDMSFNRSGKKLTGKIAPVVLKATDIETILPLKKKFRLDPSAGKITIGGDYRADFSKSPVTVGGPLSITLQGLNGELLDYEFSGLNGRLQMASLYPWSLVPDQKISLYSLNAGKELTDMRIRIEGNQGEVRILDLQSRLAGGIFQIKPFTWYGDGKKNAMTIQLKNIKLSALVGESSSLTADGSISGTIPVRLEENSVMIDNGILKSDQPASFKYAPKELPAALQGDDPRMATARLALSDYRYDSLQIMLDGALNGNLKTALTAKGTSPAFDNRAVNLNLNLEGALTSALRQALQPGQLAGKLQKQFAEDK